MTYELQDLINLYLDLKKNKFWGNINITFQNGEPVTLEKKQVYKLKDLNTVSIEVRAHI